MMARNVDHAYHIVRNSEHEANVKIAVTSQNRKTITEHAGRCRKFWVFNIENNRVIDKEMLELAKVQSFHESSQHAPHPIDHVDVLIAGGMGQGLMNRLESKGIKGVVTKEEDPERAVSLYLSGSLISEQAHQHDHDHDE
jgi:predicted Fe-Mo cluster-binding NifX family protein